METDYKPSQSWIAIPIPGTDLESVPVLDSNDPFVGVMTFDGHEGRSVQMREHVFKQDPEWWQKYSITDPNQIKGMVYRAPFILVDVDPALFEEEKKPHAEAEPEQESKAD